MLKTERLKRKKKKKKEELLNFTSQSNFQAKSDITEIPSHELIFYPGSWWQDHKPTTTWRRLFYVCQHGWLWKSLNISCITNEMIRQTSVMKTLKNPSCFDDFFSLHFCYLQYNLSTLYHMKYYLLQSDISTCLAFAQDSYGFYFFKAEKICFKLYNRRP